MNYKMFSCIFALTVFMVGNQSLYAGLFGDSRDKQSRSKMVYVRDFNIEEGYAANDQIKYRVREIIQEVFQRDNRYEITADDDIAVVIEQEEKAMSIAKCTSDACIRKLMEKINAEVVVFGRVRKINDYTYITARYMDRSSGVPRVSKIRTIKYRHDDYLEKGVRALGEYLVTGDDDSIDDFMDSVYNREEEERYRERRDEERKRVSDNENRYREMVVRAAEERRMQIVSRSPQLRFGYAFYHSIADEKVDQYFTEQSGFFLDWIIRITDDVNEPFKWDYFTRFFYKRFQMNDASLDPNGLVGKDVVSPSEASMYGFDMGFRFKTGRYFMMTAFDLYVLGAARYQHYTEKAPDTFDKSNEIEVSFHSLGLYAGAGVEMAFFQNVGIFVEYNIGYTPVGDSEINVEGHQVYGGVTLRTTYTPQNRYNRYYR